MTHDFEESAEFEPNMSFGKFLRKKRRLLGMNQTDFGELIGATQGTVSVWEMGVTSPSVEDATKIVKFLGGELSISNRESLSDYQERVGKVLNIYFEKGYTETVI